MSKPLFEIEELGFLDSVYLETLKHYVLFFLIRQNPVCY